MVRVYQLNDLVGWKWFASFWAWHDPYTLNIPGATAHSCYRYDLQNMLNLFCVCWEMASVVWSIIMQFVAVGVFFCVFGDIAQFRAHAEAETFRPITAVALRSCAQAHAGSIA
jgi:hypothetical protein